MSLPSSIYGRGRDSNLIIHLATSIMVLTNKLNALNRGLNGLNSRGRFLSLIIETANALQGDCFISWQNSPYVAAKAARSKTAFASHL